MAPQPPRSRDQYRRATQQGGGTHQLAAVFLTGWARVDVPGDAFAQQYAELAVPAGKDRTQLGASLRIALRSASYQKRTQ
jgi:hypothetical protein